MPISNFFNQVTRKAGQVWGQADRALGGWLPGGGTASPLTRIKQEGERELAKQREESLARQDTSYDYRGKPGRFAGQGQVLNALRAVTQAGASPLGVVLSNPEEIEKVSQYYAANPDIQNEYDLNTNMFLRYLSGTGAENLQIPQTVGRQIYSDIKQTKEVYSNPAFMQSALSEAKRPEAKRSWYKQKLERGYTPVYYASGDAGPETGLSRRFGDASPAEQKSTFKSMHTGTTGEQWQLRNSLGSTWVDPSSTDDKYTITNERYDFGYAPKNRGGYITDTSFWKRPAFLPISPDMIGRGIVTQGYGKPFSYSLDIDSTGNVKVKPQ